MIIHNHLQVEKTTKGTPPDLQYKYIIHAIDHYSSFRFAESVVNKSAVEVFNFIRRLFSIIGYPIILHTDNGGEFRNAIIESYLSTHSIEYRHSKPYTPTTQGKIERANQTLEMAINKLIKSSKHKSSWYDVMHEAVYSINTNISQSTNKSPYELVFLQEPHRQPQKMILDDELVEDDSSNIDTLIQSEQNISVCDLTSDTNDTDAIDGATDRFRKRS